MKVFQLLLIVFWIYIGNSIAENTTSFTICQEEYKEMTCPNGTYLEIDSFFYGRIDNNTCPDPVHSTHLTHANCSTPPGSLEKLRKYCHGRQSCWLVAGNAQWGNNPQEPNCNGVYRQATVEYKCKACEDKSSESECYQSQKSGTYDLENCFKTSTQCGMNDCGNSYGTSPNTSHQCDLWAMWAREECTFGSAAGFMLSSCAETCHACPANLATPPAFSSGTFTICQDELTEMSCANGSYIQVNSFFYGRKDHNTCPDKQHGTHLKQNNCSTPPGSLQRLQKICDGRNSCWFRAGPSQWGEDNVNEPHCNGVYRQATVNFSCKACANSRPDAECEQLKSQGLCHTDSVVMDTCFKTCTLCGSNDCGNTHDVNAVAQGAIFCDEYAMWKREECDFAPGFMLGACKESCHACSGKCLVCTEKTTDSNTTSVDTTANTTNPNGTVENISTSSGIEFSLCSSWHGRVEVLYNGVLGTVCDDGWNEENCKVLCKQLNFSGGMQVLNSYGPGQGPIWLDHVKCNGMEANLKDCQHNDWGVNNCDHSEDAGCICDDPNGNKPTAPPLVFEVRLSEGWKGRVEVISNNVMGTVCDDGWTDENCKVVCKQLNLTGGKSKCCAKYGEGIGVILLDHVECDGTETSLQQCTHNPVGITNCKHSEDASCECDDPNAGNAVNISP